MTVVIPEISPIDLLTRFRGKVIDAAPGYPEVIHLEVEDADGGKWTFSTFDAGYTPSDPDAVLGKTVVATDIAPSNTLTISFSDGSNLTVVPRNLEPGEEDDDLENWFLLTPENLALSFGPVGRWRLGRGDEPW